MADALNKTVAGVGPVVCREAAWRAFDGEHLLANELTEAQKHQLMAAIDELKEIYDEGGCPCSVTAPDGKPVEYTFFRPRQKIGPGRLGGRGIGQTGQELTDIAVLKIHPLKGVDDLSVLHQHQIGVAAHQLRAEDVPHKVAHLVGALELEVDDAVARLHPDVQQTPAGEMLPHQHTEGGRRFGVLEALLGQADSCRAAPGRQQQAVGIGAGAQGDDQLIAGRLKQFCDLGVGQRGLQFRRRQRQCRGIQCHFVLPRFIINKYKGRGRPRSRGLPAPGMPRAAFRPPPPSPEIRWRSGPPR